jgi:hypothetical protein
LDGDCRMASAGVAYRSWLGAGLGGRDRKPDRKGVTGEQDRLSLGKVVDGCQRPNRFG